MAFLIQTIHFKRLIGSSMSLTDGETSCLVDILKKIVALVGLFKAICDLSKASNNRHKSIAA